jgi:hypothetical protein
MRGCLDGQSRKTDHFIEQSFKGLNSAWASGVFAGSSTTARPKAGACPPRESAHLWMWRRAESHDFQRAGIFAGNCAWFLHCDLRCIQMAEKRGTRLWHLMKC